MQIRTRCIILVAAVFAVLLVGCDDAPPFQEDQWSYSNSISEPDPIDLNGVHWVPASWNNEYRWIYYPQQVWDLIQLSRRMPANTSLTTSIKGQSWTFLRDADRFHIQAPWESHFNIVYTVGDQAPSDVSMGDSLVYLISSAVAIGAVILIAGIYVVVRESNLSARTTTIEEQVAVNDKQLGMREVDVAKAISANEAYRAELDLWVQKQREQLDQERRQLTTEREQALDLINAERKSLAKNAPTAEHVGKFLRDAHLQQSPLGEFIDLVYLTDHTGFVRFMWAVRADRVAPPRLTIWRGKKEIRTHVGFNGECGDHVLCGRRYMYKFVLTDDKGRQLGNPVLVEVKIPTVKQWRASLELTARDHEKDLREKFKARFRHLKITEELKLQMKTELRTMSLSPDDTEFLESQVDAIATELRDEARGQK